jgi:tetratricopeptide (TPR) repeat protein
MAGVEQAHYDFFHAGGALGGREGGDWKEVAVDDRGTLLQRVLLQLTGNQAGQGAKLFDPQDFRVNLNRPDGELLHHAIQLHAVSTSLSSRGHAEKAVQVWTQAADVLRRVAAARDPEVAQAARLKLGSMMHQSMVERAAAGDSAGALAAGEEALRMLKPAAAPAPQVHDAPARSPISARISVMMRLEYGRCLNNLGTLRSGQGQAATARQLFEEAVAVDRTLIGEADEAPLELARALRNHSTALLAASEFDKAAHASHELVAHAFQAMQEQPALADELMLDPLRTSTAYATAGHHRLAQALVDQAIGGYRALLPSDPVRFTDLLAKGYFVAASVAAAEQRHADVAESAFLAASTFYTYKDLLYGGSRDRFVESEYHEAFTHSTNLFHSAMIQSGRQSEVIAKLAELDMRPAPTEGPAAEAYLLMETATSACNAFFEAPSEATQAVAQEAIERVESFFMAHPGHADLQDLEREWERMMAQLRRT